MTTDPSCLPPPPLHFKLKTNLSPDHLIIDFVYFALVLPTRFSWTVSFPRYLSTQKHPLNWNVLARHVFYRRLRHPDGWCESAFLETFSLPASPCLPDNYLSFELFCFIFNSTSSGPLAWTVGRYITKTLAWVAWEQTTEVDLFYQPPPPAS